MTTKTFAPDYPRNDDGQIIFPPDNKRRRELFVPESFDHPARAQTFMVEALIEYLSEPGDLIIDPFGGSGTLLVGLTMGRHVGLIELTEEYYDMCNKNAEFIMENIPGELPDALIIHGPNQERIPQFADVQAFIFSPPYAGALATAGGKLADWGGYTKEHTQTYSDMSEKQGNQTPYNLGGFSNFMWMQEMKKLYKLCLDALKPGGYVACIVKDRISKGVKEELGYRTLQDMQDMGYEVHAWERLFMAGSHYTKWHKSKGTEVIQEEHLIMMQKPL